MIFKCVCVYEYFRELIQKEEGKKAICGVRKHYEYTVCSIFTS